MFPCKQYFTLITCPFLTSQKLCTKPYCQFSHIINNSESDLPVATSTYKKYLDASSKQDHQPSISSNGVKSEETTPPKSVQHHANSSSSSISSTSKSSTVLHETPAAQNIIFKQEPTEECFSELDIPTTITGNSSSIANNNNNNNLEEIKTEKECRAKSPLPIPRSSTVQSSQSSASSSSAAAVASTSNVADEKRQRTLKKVNKFLLKRYYEIFNSESESSLSSDDANRKKRRKIEPSSTSSSAPAPPPPLPPPAPVLVPPLSKPPSSAVATTNNNNMNNIYSESLSLSSPPAPEIPSVNRFRCADPIARARERLHQKLLAEATSESPKEAPTMPLKLGHNIPLLLRQKYLKQLWSECIKVFGPGHPLAHKRTLDEEQACHDKSQSKAVYINSLVACIRRIRQEIPTGKSSSSDNNNKGNSQSVGIYTSPKHTEEELHSIVTGTRFYSLLLRYLLSQDQLVANGFPRPLENKSIGMVKIPRPPSADRANDSSRVHLCCRCGASFTMDIDMPVMKECVYHWGKAFARRVPGVGVEQRYTCCSATLFQQGCQICPSHVYDTNKWKDNRGYQRALPPLELDSEDYGVYAIDCEMVYTTAGIELARITIVDRKLKVVYDTLVKPVNVILDYNTRFSGLTKESFENVTTNIVDVQSHLIRLFSEKTILIGHSLESDLVALKFVHDYVVDTSVVFPHRLGPPKKRALKNIASDELNLVIQASSDGHDSFEDAATCMRLMQFMVKGDVKKMPRPSG